MKIGITITQYAKVLPLWMAISNRRRYRRCVVKIIHATHLRSARTPCVNFYAFQNIYGPFQLYIRILRFLF